MTWTRVSQKSRLSPALSVKACPSLIKLCLEVNVSKHIIQRLIHSLSLCANPKRIPALLKGKSNLALKGFLQDLPCKLNEIRNKVFAFFFSSSERKVCDKEPGACVPWNIPAVLEAVVYFTSGD